MPERSGGIQQHGLHVRTVLAVLGGLGLVLFAVGLAVHGFAKWLEMPLAGPNAPMDAPIAGARLETAPQYDRAQYFAEKQHLLESYAWIDRSRGIARIPIDVAMDILARKENKTAPAARSLERKSAPAGTDRGVEQ